MIEPPPAKFHTARDETLATLGGRWGDFSRVWLSSKSRRACACGDAPGVLMPWQRKLGDVAGEVLPSGRMKYPLVVVTVQRQAGKSHFAMARNGERALSRAGWRSWYTAQTGQDARDQFLKFNDDVVAGTPLAKVVRTLRGNGHEEMKFPNVSGIRPFPPTEEALHGKQADGVDIDEAWSFEAEQGKAILQAISPTKLTRPLAQTWIWSAGGTAASTWLAELVARGREGDPSLCYVEYGIPDDLTDLDDLEQIAAYHPALGHTISPDALAAMRAELTDDAEWARAAGNRWTEVIGGLIPAKLWTPCRYPDPVPDDDRPVGYGAARAADGSQVVIACAVEVDGVPVVEVLDVLPSGYRAEETIGEWATDGPLAVGRHGASTPLYDKLERAGLRQLMKLQTGDEAAAAAQLLDALPHRGIRFRQHPTLDAAVEVAVKRTVGDGGFVWSRSAGGAPIAALEAAGLAVFALAHRPKPIGRPRIITATR